MIRKRFPTILACAVFLALTPALVACMWDYDTLKMERSRFPSTLELITGKFLRHSPEFYRWRIQDREQRLKDHPSETALYDDLAVAYDKIGDDDKAVELMLKKDRLAPGQYETYANLGTFYLHAGQYDKGITMIDKALYLNPSAHFGREKYQKYLAEYVESKRVNGKVRMPLDTLSEFDPRSGPIGFYAFLKIKLDIPERMSGMPAEREDAIKGILGILRFGKHDSPVLLEALGDLLLVSRWHYREKDATELGARAFLKASYGVNDEQARNEYRAKVAASLEHIAPGGYSRSLAGLEADFKTELADADAWYRELREKEIGWIRDGKNPEEEFDKLYTADPVVASPQDSVFNPRNSLPFSMAVLLGLGLVLIVTVGGIVYLCIRLRKSIAW